MILNWSLVHIQWRPIGKWLATVFINSSERLVALKEVLKWLKEVLKWLEEVQEWLEEFLKRDI